MRKDITGIILCGGKSSRMQTNKALLKLNKTTVIEIVLNEMQKIFSDVLISTNDCDKFSFLKIPLVRDLIVNRGPLSGIYSALKESKTEKNFITTCDLPLINYHIIDYLVNISSNNEIIIPTINGLPQRLFGVYNKSLTTKIEEIFSLSENDKTIKGSIYDLHQRAAVELIEIDHLPFYNKNMFMNMNTQEDYKTIKNIYENK
jgi:molybdopterin-guanine dinucleotide biosynthesis protein A